MTSSLFIFHVVTEEWVDPGRLLASKDFPSQCQERSVIELDLCALMREWVSGLKNKETCANVHLRSLLSNLSIVGDIDYMLTLQATYTWQILYSCARWSVELLATSLLKLLIIGRFLRVTKYGVYSTSTKTLQNGLLIYLCFSSQVMNSETLYNVYLHTHSLDAV